jgi:hypothetical protein
MFKYLKSKALSLDTLTDMIKAEKPFGDGSRIYFRKQEGDFKSGAISSGSIDCSVDTEFFLFGFESAEPAVREAIYFHETYGTNWFVVTGK